MPSSFFKSVGLEGNLVGKSRNPYIGAERELQSSDPNIICYVSDGNNDYRFIYVVKGKKVSVVHVDNNTGHYRIANMYTLPKYRRKGYARKLYEAANKKLGIHIPFSLNLSEDGRAFKTSVYANGGLLDIPNLPNTMNFWHGGNLDDYDDIIAQKSGRYEYGAGLYLTTHYDTAYKYSKGSRKLYLITVEKGVDINDAVLDYEPVKSFIQKYAVSSKRKEVFSRLERFNKDGKVKAYVFNNILINEKAIKPINTQELRKFLVSNGIDYEIVDNPYGWHEKMMVLYNMTKIVKTVIVKPSDKLTNEMYNLPTDFYARGGSLAQTPAPKSDKIYGSDKNKPNTATAGQSKKIKLSERTIEVLKEKLADFRDKNPSKNNVTLNDLKAVYRRGSGAYSSSHRPTITGGAPNSRAAWSFARVNKFLKKAAGEAVKKAYVQDDDLLKFDNGGLIAPNGNPSKLTPEQYKLVRTPEFKAWFGDWENSPETASKVVDENGEPLVVYHGTMNNFNIFNTYIENGTYHGKGAYFTSSIKDLNTNYVTTKQDKYLECFLNIRNPLVVGKKAESTWFEKNQRDIIKDNLRLFSFPRVNYAYEKSWDSENLEKIVRSEFGENESGNLLNKIYRYLNFDGIIYLSPNKLKGHKAPLKTKHFVAFLPTQIKIADGTNATFDSKNADIRYKDGGLVASNGKPSNLTPEQYELVRTPEFKAWFGDWENDPENASKVVDVNGEPLVVYHGSDNYFTVFDMALVGTGSGSKRTKLGSYFSSQYSVAETYIHNIKKDEFGWDVRDGNIFKVFLNLRNPVIIDGGHKNILWWDREIAAAEGSRGIIIRNTFDTFSDFAALSDVFIVFEPTQIKLADGSNKTFDGSNPDIRFSEGGLANSDFFKEKTIENAKRLGATINGDIVYLYHGTSPSNQKKILKSNKLNSGTWFAADMETSRRFGMMAISKGLPSVSIYGVYAGSILPSGDFFTSNEDLYLKNGVYMPKDVKIRKRY